MKDFLLTIFPPLIHEIGQGIREYMSDKREERLEKAKKEEEVSEEKEESSEEEVSEEKEENNEEE